VHLENRFSVSLPVDEAWTVLLDVEQIAPCMPGAQIDDVIDDGFAGTVKVKLGAIVATFKGTVTFTEADETQHRIVLHASGRETKGQGNATADVTVQLTAAGKKTDVVIDTELSITGRIVQFGRGVIVDVSKKMIGEFVTCLEGKLARQGAGAAS
jgi:carbon monoxide dehydrogenase subunit G